MSDCRGCGKPIVWIETEEGTRIPLDPRAQVYVLYKKADDPRQLGKRTTQAMVTHFATCPKAGDFSGSNKTKAGA